MGFDFDNKSNLSKQRQDDFIHSISSFQLNDLEMSSSRINLKLNKSLNTSRSAKNLSDDRTNLSFNSSLNDHSSNYSFDIIKSSLMTRHKNSFVCPNFNKAGIAPVFLPETVARDFQDRCFTTDHFKKLKNYSDIVINLPQVEEAKDYDRTTIGNYESLLRSHRRTVSPSRPKQNLLNQRFKKTPTSNEGLLLSPVPPTMRRDDTVLTNRSSIKAENSKLPEKNFFLFYKQSGVNKYDWNMNKNTFARKFNSHCNTPKSWLKMKYSNKNDNLNTVTEIYIKPL